MIINTTGTSLTSRLGKQQRRPCRKKGEKRAADNIGENRVTSELKFFNKELFFPALPFPNCIKVVGKMNNIFRLNILAEQQELQPLYCSAGNFCCCFW